MSSDAEIRLGKEALARGDAAEAERHFDAAIDAGGPAAETLRGRAEARARLRNWGGAADDLDRLFRAFPDDATPVEREYIRVLRLAQSLPEDKAERTVRDFGWERMANSVSLRSGTRFVSIDDFVTRASVLAQDKYASSPPENLKQYLGAKIPSRLYRAPALQGLPAMDAWGRCEWWVYHGLGAADAAYELATGEDMGAEEPSLPPPPYSKGSEPADLAERCPVDWAFVHHALIVMAYDLAEDLADEQPQLRTDLPGIRDAAIKPLVYLGFAIGLESQGI